MSDLPAGWICVPAGDICEIVGGSTPTTSEPRYWGGEINWITPDDLSKNRSKVITKGARSITVDGYASCSARMLPAGAVLYTTRAPIGYVAIASGPVCTNQGFKSFIPPVGLASDYLYWYFRYATPEIRKMGSGTTFAEISAKVARTIPILVPPTSEQHRIVQAIEEQFSRLEAGVASLWRAKRNLARMRASVLAAAVEGRLVEQDVRDDPATTLLAELATEKAVAGIKVRTAPASEIVDHPLPAGWAWATLDEIAAAEPRAITDGPFGSNLKTAHYTSSGPRVIRLQNIGDGRFIDERAHISPEHFEMLKAHAVQEGDLVVALLGTELPRACVVPSNVSPAIVKADCLRLRPGTTVSPGYLNIALNSEPVRKRTSNMVHGVGRPRLNSKEMRIVTLPVPPAAEQRRIVSEVDRQFSVLDAMNLTVNAGLARAERLHQSILREAFAGRLVSQDPADEPASVLLERIQSERVTG